MPAETTVRAAGAVVWRVKHGELQVLAIHRPRYNDWSWPKGKLESGEHILGCAIREVGEESGRQVILGAPLPQMSYRLGGGKLKTVDYWTARVADDDDNPAICARPAFHVAPPSEIDRSEWLSLKRARTLIRRPDDAALVDDVEDRYRDGVLDTTALILLRHSKAVIREQWNGREEDRPIETEARRRARALLPLLSAYGVTAVETSPWMRCLGTVLPYARQARLRAERRPWLTEASCRDHPGEVSDHVFAMIDKGIAASTALCTHRPVLAELMEPLRRRYPEIRRIPREDPYLRTSEMLVLHLARDGRVTAAEKHRPPRRA